MAVALATAAAVGVGGLVIVKITSRRKAVEPVPQKMKRLVLTEANADLEKAKLEVQEVDVPKPKYNEVLVKLAAAPINPSDYGVWQTKPAFGYPLPLGNEGSGTVVATGGGFFANRLLGCKVVVSRANPGTYAQYATVNAVTGGIFTLPDDVPVENGCAFFVNPFTVVGIVETAKEHGGKAFIHTAAASQLGQMMVQYCKQEGATVVNIVRREDQAEIIRKLGAEYIVVSGKEGWQAELEALIKKLDVRCAFDAIAGEMTGTLLSMLPHGGAVWVYGKLAPEGCSHIQPLDLIYKRKTVQGWFLPGWLMKGSVLSGLRRTLRTAGLVRKHLKTTFASHFQDTTLENLQKDYAALHKSSRTGTKLRLRH